MLGIIFLLALAVVAFRNNGVQNYLAGQVTRQLSEKLHTRVSIGKIDYRYFNSFRFDSLYIEDQQRDTLIFVERGYAGFDFWKFFSGKYVFKEIKIEGLYGNLVIDTAGVSNLDFVIKAFSKPQKPKKESKVEFNFKTVRINDSRFRLTNLQHPAASDANRFDGNRMDFRHLNLVLNVDYLKKDSLSARIRSFSAVERSGLTISNIETVVHGWKKGFHMPYLNVSLPHTSLLLDSVSMTYDSVANLRNMLNKVKWNARIKNSKVAMKDLAAFAPNFRYMKENASVRGLLTGRISSFRLHEMEMNYGKSLTLKADLDLNGIPNLDETFIYANIRDFHVNKGDAQDFISQLSHKPFVLPKELSRLGVVRYTGNISGFFSNLVAYGNITTNAGSLNTDILLQLENKLSDLKYNGTIRTQNFQLGQVLNTKLFGKTAFKITTKGTKLHNRSLQGTISGDIAEIYLNKYNYQNISLDGNYDGTGFEGKMDVKDPNLDAGFDGVVDLTKKLPVFNFDLQVNNADIHALHLTKEYKDSQLSFDGNTNMVGNSPDNLNGYLILNNIRFLNAGEQLVMDQLQFVSEVGAKFSKFTITSDLINGNFEGDFKYSTIPQTLSQIVENYIPALSGKNITGKRKQVNANNYMNIDLTLSDTKLISRVLNLPFTLDGITTVKGFVDDINERVELNARTPFLSFGSQKIRNIELLLNNEHQQLNLQASARLENQKNLTNVSLKAAAANDLLYTQFGWQNNDTINYAGEIQTNTKFNKENNLTSALVTFLPTQIVVADSTWDILGSQVSINPDTTFTVDNFRIKNRKQYINLDGTVSRKETDILTVDMNDLNLDFLMALVKLKNVSIKGNATGKAEVYSILKQPVFEADIEVKNARLNNSPIGNAYLYSTWDRENKELQASGTFIDGKDTVALANGVYIPAKDSIDFIYDAHRLNLGFLTSWLSSFSKEVTGLGTGKVRMFGKTKSIGFEGSVFAENAKLSVEYLKTSYSFTDSVYLTRKSIALKNITVYDEEKNRGYLNGLITHDGNFNNMKYDLKINARNMLALNTQPRDNEFFYGKAYASGNVNIYGNMANIYIDVNASTQPKTKVFISVGGAAIANENNFITFVNQKDTTKTKTKDTVVSEAKPTRLRMNLMVDVTPDAEIQLIIDPKAGDMLSGTGSGSLRMEYDDFSDIKLYGTYTIDEGKYLFTLQNLLRKDFKINQGSNISWTGDMLRAQMNITAIYSQTVSLRDLMNDAILSSTSRTSVPVNSVLKLTGDLMTPDIKFDIDLPTSDETLKMQVRNLINTEEMMNRQMMYLLLFNKFYTPDYAKGAATFASSLGNNTWSLFANTAFGQINNWLSQMTNTFQFGANIRSTGLGSESAQEYEAEISYQPNNRLLVNGNLGYRNDDLAKNKIIGDVDVEYILTENGKLRLKAYNHTVDRYTLRSAPFIQGVGVMYKETFNTWDELLRHYFNVLTKPAKTPADTTKTEPTNNETN